MNKGLALLCALVATPALAQDYDVGGVFDGGSYALAGNSTYTESSVSLGGEYSRVRRKFRSGAQVAFRPTFAGPVGFEAGALFGWETVNAESARLGFVFGAGSGFQLGDAESTGSYLYLRGGPVMGIPLGEQLGLEVKPYLGMNTPTRGGAPGLNAGTQVSLVWGNFPRRSKRPALPALPAE